MREISDKESGGGAGDTFSPLKSDVCHFCEWASNSNPGCLLLLVVGYKLKKSVMDCCG